MRVITFPIDYTGQPVIDLFVAPGAERASELLVLGEPPQRLRVRALIDSGASRSSIQRSILDELRIQATSETEVNTASTGRFPIVSSTFKVRLYLQRVVGEMLASNLVVVEAEDLSGLNVDLLVDRDVLGRCLTVYNGVERSLTIASEPPPPEE